MRKLIISVLLAGAAASPALAQDHGRWHQDEAQSNNQQSHEDRSQAREQRQEMREQVRSERGGGNAERMQEVQQQQQARQQQQQARQFEGRQQWQSQGGTWDRSRIEDQRAAQQQILEQQQRQQQAERNYRGYRGGFAGQVQQVDPSQRSGNWARDRRNWSQDRDGDFRQRQVEQQRARQGSRWASGGWNRDWRNDRRYDWRNYRERHRSVFRLGIYFDPFGYGYRPFDIGYNLSPLYFGQRYWIDPALYQLPYPPPGTVWVRYWNDAVLVDTYTGEVVDVIHNFFW